MSFGLVARCDAGGLGTITREVFRHLKPARTLLLDLGTRGRGTCAESAYDLDGVTDQSVYRARFDGGLPQRAVEWITSPGIDTLFSAETFYDDRVLRAARANGIRTVVCAMPELAPWALTSPDLARDPSMPRPSVITVPTSWRAETLPGAEILPVPVARDRLPFRQRTRVEHLYHPTGAAMLDRNGTDLLVAALQHVRSPCRLTIRSERPIRLPRGTRVDVTVVSDATADYWSSVPSDADLLVLPRRYGGLCLPLQECASLGMPALMIESDSYWGRGFIDAVLPTRSRARQMKGGMVDVWDSEPRPLAQMIDELIEAPNVVRRMSRAAGEWAETHAWSGPLGDAWCQMLDAECGREERAA